MAEILMVLTHEALLEASWRRHGEGRGCHRRHCLACGHGFFTSRPEARYCRAACRQRAYRARVRLTPRGEEVANSLPAKGEVDDLPKPLNLDEVEFLPIDPLDTAADGTATKEDAHDARA